ncbi:ATP-binding cassette domain-containing protein [Agrobacterium deltaense]|nr:ATP-binding cassette domain-containing protein [Agrobacterium deltaense]
MTPGLVLDAVGVRQGKTQIIHSLSVGIGRGQIAALIGPNGAGKSTLLGAVAGHVVFTGAITWNGCRPGGGKVGFMPQYCAVQSSLSVLEVLLLGLREKLGWHVNTRQATPGSLNFYLTKLARLGGYLARTSDPPPGNTVVWRSLCKRRPQLSAGCHRWDSSHRCFKMPTVIGSN